MLKYAESKNIHIVMVGTAVLFVVVVGKVGTVENRERAVGY